ncbi:hypothetical protein Cgig2_011963 [Carnegiea gigantea]|uniref:Uncharacterized protein n=1 Tax=Carnegiea gigantea TaxID=171969 RepID=A0A9Q1GJI8_9CARY|nr:hypothetical protein Cgig2_011963 [Carnegiea gigantea]
MALENNEIKKGGATKEFFKWCYDATTVLCDVIIQYIMKNGLTSKFGRLCATNCCKHKYDAMRKDCFAWKQLRNIETGLGCNPISGKIEASTAWWDKEIKHIHGGTYATRENIYVPTMEPPIINVEEQGEGHESKNHTEGRLGEEDNLHMYNLQDNPYFQSVLADEDQFFTDFVEYVSNGNDDNTKANNESRRTKQNEQASIIHVYHCYGIANY